MPASMSARINPSAVESSLKLGGKIVWLPTTSARNHMVKMVHTPDGCVEVVRDGKIVPELKDVFRLVSIGTMAQIRIGVDVEINDTFERYLCHFHTPFALGNAGTLWETDLFIWMKNLWGKVFRIRCLPNL
ncbi:DUF6282 family protein [Enterocloster clostridioformis]|uniref:DUF6282 family protein n=1 Tax=Enterocloster clostridioformis TaxID=1531 RepID=UPI002FE56F10